MVIGFFLFLVLLLLIFILISYLRKWYRLKKRPAEAVAPAVTSATGPVLAPGEDTIKYAKRYSKSTPGSQPATPLVKSAPKSSLSSTPVEIRDCKVMKPMKGGVHSQQYHQNIAHQQQQQMYQEFPPVPHYQAHHMAGNAVPPMPHSILSSKVADLQPTNTRAGRLSLATITLT